MVDASDHGVCLNNQFSIAFDPVAMTNTDFADFDDFGNQIQVVVEFRGGVVLDIHFPNDKHVSGLLDRLVLNPTGTQHFDASAFEEVEIIRVVDPLLTVRFVVRHPNLNSMALERRRIGRRRMQRIDGGVIDRGRRIGRLVHAGDRL